MIKHRILIPIYNCHLTIFVANNFEEVVMKYDPSTKEDEVKSAVAYVIVLRDKKTGINEYLYIQRPVLTYGEIAHEAKHIVNRIFRDREIELDRYNDEYECYFLGYIVDKIIEYINKK